MRSIFIQTALMPIFWFSIEFQNVSKFFKPPCTSHTDSLTTLSRKPSLQFYIKEVKGKQKAVLVQFSKPSEPIRNYSDQQKLQMKNYSVQGKLQVKNYSIYSESINIFRNKLFQNIKVLFNLKRTMFPKFCP